MGFYIDIILFHSFSLQPFSWPLEIISYKFLSLCLYLMQMDEAIVNGWLFFRYLVIGGTECTFVTIIMSTSYLVRCTWEWISDSVSAYVGLATVAGFAWWFLYFEDGPRLSYTELVIMLTRISSCAFPPNMKILTLLMGRWILRDVWKASSVILAPYSRIIIHQQSLWLC